MFDRLVLCATLPFALASGAGGWTLAAQWDAETAMSPSSQSIPFIAQANLFAAGWGATPADEPQARPPLVVQRANDGLFHTMVMADGRAVRMVIDTGATNTIMSSRLAERHFPGRRMVLRGKVSTVGGPVDYRVLTIERFKVGSRKLDNLEIAVVDGGGEFALLGQDVLSQIGPIGINGEELTLP